MAEKGDKVDKEEKIEKREKVKGLKSIQVVSLILILLLIIIVLIVVQVPYTTTNVVKETVPIQNCSNGDMPFVVSFRSGLNYDTSPRFSASDGVALRAYSDLKTNVFASVRNMGDEKGVYCVKAETYYIANFADEANKLATFQVLLAENSSRIDKLENDIPDGQACTQNPILPKQTDIISFWTTALSSEDIQNEYKMDDIYVLFTVVSPPSSDCTVQYVDQLKEQEVTKYCNAWKHIVGMC